MKIKIVKPVEYDVDILEVFVKDYFHSDNMLFRKENGEEFQTDLPERLFEKFPTLEKNGGLYLQIRLDCGLITNWPTGWSCGFNSIKVVDAGEYKLYDTKGELIHEYNGYVPNILAINDNGYGDYFEFDVYDDGSIKAWECTEELLEELVSHEEY